MKHFILFAALLAASIHGQDGAQYNIAIRAQFEADSNADVVARDSVVLHKAEVGFFRGQIALKGKIDVPTRIECTEFLLSHKLRAPADALQYLTLLQKWCLDRSEWIRAVRVTMPDEDKYRAVGAFHHAQADCAAIQALIDRLTFSREQ